MFIIIQTIFLVKFLYLKCILPANTFEQFKICFVPLGNSSKSWAWYLSKRTEIHTVYSKSTEISCIAKEKQKNKHPRRQP